MYIVETDATSSEKSSNQEQIKSESNENAKVETSESLERIGITKKYQSVFQELLKQYLIILDHWPQGSSSEFYNQVFYILTLMINYLF